MGKRTLTKINAARVCQSAHLALWISLAVAGAPQAAEPVGQPICGNRLAMLADAERIFGEQVVAAGLHANGSLVEVLASKGGRTWTIIISGPDGRACIAGAGQRWLAVPQPAGTPA